MGLFSRLFKRKSATKELGVRKPIRSPKQKAYLFKIETQIEMKGEVIGRLPAFTMNAYNRAHAEKEFNKHIKIKITKIHRA